jgi:hypothetical protein
MQRHLPNSPYPSLFPNSAAPLSEQSTENRSSGARSQRRLLKGAAINVVDADRSGEFFFGVVQLIP